MPIKTAWLLLVTVVLSLLSSTLSAQSQSWETRQVDTRPSRSGETPNIRYALFAPNEKPESILIFVSTFASSSIGQPKANGGPAMVYNNPWVRLAPFLHVGGIKLVIMDPASDAKGRAITSRPVPDITADITAVMEDVAQQYPQAKIHIAGFGPDSGELIWAVSNMRKPAKLVIASGDFRGYRAIQWPLNGHPVLVLHAPSAQCDSTSYLDTEYVANKNNFTLIKVGYEKPETESNCTPSSQSQFSGQDVQVALPIIQWLRGKPINTTVGYPNPPLAWQEEVSFYEVPGEIVSNKQEMTVLYPPGNGPFPLLLFSHGDVPKTSDILRTKQRIVIMGLARLFLSKNWAVAFPMRAGVGLSDGLYETVDPKNKYLTVNVGDKVQNLRKAEAKMAQESRRNLAAETFNPTSRAEFQGQQVLAAIEALRKNPKIDGKRMVVSGQSAGGNAAMWVGSLNIPGVKGIINFAGGPTDALTSTNGYTTKPSEYFSDMINSFTEYGQTAKSPTLFIYTENDSRYSVPTIQKAFAGFNKGNPRSKLMLYPPIQGDGHAIYHYPQIWQEPVTQFIQGL